MGEKHSIIAKNVRLQNWYNDFLDCQGSNLGVEDWCRQRGMNMKTYYYHVKRVREAYLKEHQVDILPEGPKASEIVRFAELQPPSVSGPVDSPTIVISAGSIRIEVNETVSDASLRKIIGVLADVI